jgi:hypothetical protein
MKNLPTYEDFLNEAINDPVLMAIRAAKDKRKKLDAEYKARMKKRVYGKKREALEDELIDISQELKDLYSEKRDTYNEMESEAGQKGDAWTDDDANRYGGELNKIDDQIEKLIKRRSDIEIKLAY